ncbi:MAG: radical SAM protein [candidate division Zixibacteria bacterium CG_4_9_14_3_um_filter_46_8]|nr:MAG: radical SAM protein [candidate division Zixibacteria bacterium CG_4_9_14_3_um_filter_46_8]
MNSLVKHNHSADIIDKANSLLSPCRVCPRMCGVDRLSDETYGECRTGLYPLIASANLHFGEEPPISGFNGSGTIFFASCNLSCRYCQNYPISQYSEGRKATPEDLAHLMMKLQKRGAHNINFVTPTHVVPQIIKAYFLARENGFHLPLVYNSSGYDSVETLKLLEGIIDMYMPDMRYNDPQIALKLSRVSNYPQVNRAAIHEMHRQVGSLQVDDDGIGTRGLLIRHLILPNEHAGSEGIFKFIAEEISKDTYVSLMSQYFPAYKAVDDPELNRKITKKEFHRAVDAFYGAGLSKGFIQPEPE